MHTAHLCTRCVGEAWTRCHWKRYKAHMAKHTAKDFSENEARQAAELAFGVYWARSHFHAALDVITQKCPQLDVAEQERLARRVAAVMRVMQAALKRRQSPSGVSPV